jgi:hypothetical protein
MGGFWRDAGASRYADFTPPPGPPPRAKRLRRHNPCGLVGPNAAVQYLSRNLAHKNHINMLFLRNNFVTLGSRSGHCVVRNQA